MKKSTEEQASPDSKFEVFQLKVRKGEFEPEQVLSLVTDLMTAWTFLKPRMGKISFVVFPDGRFFIEKVEVLEKYEDVHHYGSMLDSGVD